MNQTQRDAASSNLKLFGVDLPHSNEECLKMLLAHQNWWAENTDITTLEQARYRAERGTLGYIAALEEAANKIKAKRLSN